MINRAMVIAALIVAATPIIGCDRAPGRRAVAAAAVPPDKILDFDVLYGRNCAGCHGAEGHGGASIALANPVYLAIADDAVVRRVTADGAPGTPMPAFASRSGGMLTDEQIDAIVKGIRTRWANPSAVAGIELPPYSDASTGDARRGSGVFVMYCESCHGAGGRGASGGSSIVDRSYLALVSDQGLRTTVIAGRPELGAPDWRSNRRDKTMTLRDISDVVAWLSAQRTTTP